MNNYRGWNSRTEEWIPAFAGMTKMGGNGGVCEMVELLAPVRDEVSLVAAVDAGADAVYFGVGRLNMRANSPGISVERIGDVVRHGHDRGVRVYVTLNSIVYDDELDGVGKLLDTLSQAGVDAVICWDPAVICKARGVGLEIHVSTQAGIANSESVRFYEELGVKRVVLARELTLEQIAKIGRETNVEIETFVHGAMCVSVSGRCLMSQFLYGRSANRGDCLQPCRHEYILRDVETGDELTVEGQAVLSPKDLCTLGILDRLIAAGIDVFKIEGRSRAPEYVAAVTRAYRRGIDAVANGDYASELVDELISEVSRVYHRDFSTGFYLGPPGAKGWSQKTGNQATQKKTYVGKILNYYKKSCVAYLNVVSEGISVGDLLQAHGTTTGVVEFRIEKLRSDECGYVETVGKGKVTLPVEILLRRNDAVYRVDTVCDTSVCPCEGVGDGL